MSLVRLWGVTVQRGGEGPRAGAGQPEPGRRRGRAGGGQRPARRRQVARCCRSPRARCGPARARWPSPAATWSSLQAGSLPYVRRNIGYLPAEPPLVRDETVLENVMLVLGARGLAPDAAEAQAAHRPGRSGHRGAGRAPGGGRCRSPERQLCALARALAGNPPVLVLDEPVAGLDERDRTRLLSALNRARQAGTAVLLGTSDAAWTIALASRGRPLPAAGGRPSGG